MNLSSYDPCTLEEIEDEGACTNPAGHSFVCADVDNGGDGRTYCEWCGADGDA